MIPNLPRKKRSTYPAVPAAGGAAGGPSTKDATRGHGAPWQRHHDGFPALDDNDDEGAAGRMALKGWLGTCTRKAEGGG